MEAVCCAQCEMGLGGNTFLILFYRKCVTWNGGVIESIIVDVMVLGSFPVRGIFEVNNCISIYRFSTVNVKIA